MPHFKGCKHPELHEHPSLSNSPHLLMPFLEDEYRVPVSENGAFVDLGSISSPRLLATHSPYVILPESVKNSNCKIVFLCRNAKDNFVSLWHYANKLRPKDWKKLPLEDAFNKFCRGVGLSGPFWDHVLEYWMEGLERLEKILFLKYEELKDNTIENLKNLAEFVGCPFSKEEEENGLMDDLSRLCSFDNMRNLEVNQNGELPIGMETRAFFKRGEVGDWINFLTPEMIGKLDSTSEERFGSHGLKL